METPSGDKTRHLWAISYPMMLSWLSAFMMVFIDRVFLARYSPSALAAAVNAGTLFWAFGYSFQTLAELTEVYVAQNNGAKRFKMIGPCCNQMLRVCAFSAIFFIPAAIWGTDLYLSTPNGVYKAEYLKYLMLFTPFHGVLGAMIAFFVGRGETSRVTKAFVLGNVANVILDPLFIFGYGSFPSLGVKGAAIATSLGLCLQCLYLLYYYFKKESREQYDSTDFSYRPKLMRQILKVGAPSASFVTLEMTAWAVFYQIMEYLSSTHILVAGVCQSIVMLLLFYGMGLQKGTSAIAGNLIGAKRTEEVNSLVRSGLILIFIFTVLSSLIFYLFQDQIVSIFVADHYHSGAQTVHTDINEGIFPLIKFGLIIAIIYSLLENIRCLFSGMLTAAGDTFFLLAVGILSLWFFLLLPTAMLTYWNLATVTTSMYIWVLFASIAALVPYLRFKTGKWKQRKILDD
ncbi:MAG: MATE family efflux transporter [Chlamydiales bacterium]|nr:MATE family efflux transporter [Chlamydiales bacterium]NCF71375.1 MATE family efflux transporter [Chlamydiales bacterium]